MTDRLADDVALLIETFKAEGWRELRIATPAISLVVSECADTPVLASAAAVPTAVPDPVEPVPPPAVRSASPIARPDGWHAIVAPNLGTFYRAPKPGAAPFVEVGDRVTASSEICLLEVMKLFTSVTAGVAGIVREIAASDAELVEGGQPLFYIEPEGA